MSNVRKPPPYEVLRRVETFLLRRHDAGLGPITRKNAAASLGLPLRVFEMAVEGLRNSRTPVCSGSTGYYWSDQPGDISDTVSYLSRIAISHSRTLRSMRRVLSAASASVPPRQMSFLEAKSIVQKQIDAGANDLPKLPIPDGGQPGAAEASQTPGAGQAPAPGVPGLPQREQDIPRRGVDVGMRDVRDGVPGVEAV